MLCIFLETHKAISRGTQAFGDILLTLRGGIPHTWVDSVPIKMGKNERVSTPDERTWRRRLISHCWLKVEDTRQAPAKYTVLTADLKHAFSRILQSEGIPLAERSLWENDCLSAISGAINTEGTWVNRHASFKDFAAQVRLEEASFDGAAGWDMLQHFFNTPTVLSAS